MYTGKIVEITFDLDLFLCQCNTFLATKGYEFCCENAWVYIITRNRDARIPLCAYLERIKLSEKLGKIATKVIDTKKGGNNMKKKEQELLNTECERVWSDAMREVLFQTPAFRRFKLPKTKSVVLETESYYILKVYGKLVACVIKADPEFCYDLSRLVSGYNATISASICVFAERYSKKYFNKKVWRV